MSKLILVLSSFILSCQLYATDLDHCRGQLSQGYTRDMNVFRMNNSEVVEYEQLNEEMAIYVVDLLLKRETSCTIQDMQENLKSSCHSFGSNRVCEVRTAIGYFLIHRGSFGIFEHAIIFGRWD